ncbi:ribosome maturation factor RimM [Fluviispira multicolorata]|uniref:Ribosome maturation factor RimM n=1 Tax=Fluviispira multicolorata TaxID=2654512 RepID=A0A833JBF5_9BACT|nr:ribosome maturation factor RimM [Fluviispira multicolorata]KAB8029129.1 16S rRNA processing protein RimM [Fluviispira multicolorata]
MTNKLEHLDEKQLSSRGYIQFAQVGRPHGLKGAFFLKTEDRRTEWDGYKKLLIETPNGFHEKKVLKAYLSGNALALVLEGFESRNDVEPLYNKKIYVHKNEISVGQNEYIVDTLKGFKVIAENKGNIGSIIGVSSFGAQDNLEIELEGSKRSVLFPFVDAFIKNIDEEKRFIEIIYVPEFFEDEDQ